MSTIYIIFFYKKKEINYLLFWFIPLLLYLSFGTTSLTQYIPFRAVDRYLSIVTIPAILLLALFLTEKNKTIKKIILPLTIIILLFASITTVYLRDDRAQLNDLRESYLFLENLDNDIYVDDRSVKVLDYISKYNLNPNIKIYPTSLSNIKDSYIMVNRGMIKNLREANKNRKFPIEVDNPPQNWQIIKEIGNIDEEKIIIYFAP